MEVRPQVLALQIKFVIQELNLPPFKLNYNLIVFDQLSGENRLQVGIAHAHAI